MRLCYHQMYKIFSPGISAQPLLDRCVLKKAWLLWESHLLWHEQHGAGVHGRQLLNLNGEILYKKKSSVHFKLLSNISI